MNPLHGSDSHSAARREIEKIFPVETTVAVIKPETAEESGGKDIIKNVQG
jgi:nucleoside diphosphate kinase